MKTNCPGPSSDTAVSIEDVHKTYPNGTAALKGISCSIKRGSFTAVVGLSGSGKSTLLRCINRLHKPTSGRLNVLGKNIMDLEESEMRQLRCRIGMIFQHFNLVERKTVLDNVLMGRLGQLGTTFWGGVLGRWPEQWIHDAHRALAQVGLADKAQVRADGLSGGQQQRVAIARTLMQQPDILLADEPVASLDPSTSHSVMEYLRRLNEEQGVTVVCNLHFLSLVREYSKHVVALKGGLKVFEGSPRDITDEWFRGIYGKDAREVEIR